MRFLWLLVVLVTACGVDATSSQAARAVECQRDDDCELVPVVTCCQECPPVPPFEAVPRATIDALLLETQERCLRDKRPCPVCEIPARGCVARARCGSGRCTFSAIGCGRPTV